MPKGVHFSTALAAVLSMLSHAKEAGPNHGLPINASLSPSELRGEFMKGLNAPKRGKSVKQQSRKAAKVRSVRRAKRHGQA